MVKLESTILSTTLLPTPKTTLSNNTSSPVDGVAPKDQLPGVDQLVVPALPVQVFCAETGRPNPSTLPTEIKAVIPKNLRLLARVGVRICEEMDTLAIISCSGCPNKRRGVELFRGANQIGTAESSVFV